MRALLWGLKNLVLLAVLMVAGLLATHEAVALGWGAGEDAASSFPIIALYVPFTAPLYLLVLWHLARQARHPRRWAIGLTPLLWLPVPYFAIMLMVPGVVAMWGVFIAFAYLLRLPDPR